MMLLPASDVELRGDGLVLRQWRPGDIGAMVELFDEASIDYWTPLESPFDAAAATRYLERSIRLQQQGHGIQLAITADGLAPLGEVLIFDGHGPGEAELAYAVGTGFRGRGLGARAVHLLAGHARQSWAVTGFRLTIATTNVASQRVAEAAGFALTAEPLVVRERKGHRFEMATWRLS